MKEVMDNSVTETQQKPITDLVERPAQEGASRARAMAPVRG